MASKPLSCAELSEVNVINMLPDVAVAVAGIEVPLYDPISLDLSVPSYTRTKSKFASVAKLLKLRVILEPVEIVHEQVWPAK